MKEYVNQRLLAEVLLRSRATLNQLVKDIGVDRQTIYNATQRKRTPSYPFIVKMTHALELSSAQIIQLFFAPVWERQEQEVLMGCELVCQELARLRMTPGQDEASRQAQLAEWITCVQGVVALPEYGQVAQAAHQWAWGQVRAGRAVDALMPSGPLETVALVEWLMLMEVGQPGRLAEWVWGLRGDRIGGIN